MGRKKKTSHSSGIVVHISADEVAEALSLAKEAKQRVKSIETDHATRFYFSVECDGHYSACEIRVSPFPVRHQENFQFLPEQRYTLCCPCAAEENLKQQRQTVYDVLIRPVQWQFKNKSIVVEVPLPMEGTSCKDKVSQGIHFLQQKEPEPTEIAQIVKSVSEKVLKAIREAERNPSICRSYPTFGGNKTDEARMAMADKLWNLSKRQKEGFETILWANRFYALCMRFILRHSQALQTDRYLDRIAKSSVLINRIASDLLVVSPDKVCFCHTNTVYNGFAKAKCLLPDIPGSDSARSAVASQVVDALRGNIIPLSGPKYIFHAPRVISYLWNEDYINVCKQLGAEGLANHDLSNRVDQIGNSDLYTYAVRCACPCDSAETDEVRDHGNLIVPRQEDIGLISHESRDSDSTALVPHVPPILQDTIVGDFGQRACVNVNKRPAIQQQCDDTTKRQRTVPDYLNTPHNVTSDLYDRDEFQSSNHAVNAPNIVSDDQGGGDTVDMIEYVYRPDVHTKSYDSTPVINGGLGDCSKAAQLTTHLEGDMAGPSVTDLTREIIHDFALNEGSSSFSMFGYGWEPELREDLFYETGHHQEEVGPEH